MTTAPTTPAPLCRACGYDLTGLAPPGACPECAHSFVELPGDDAITLAWPCLRCGYPLAGVTRRGRCSECGMPARLSVDPALFRFQPDAYRRRVRGGVTMAAFGLVGVIMMPLTLGAAGVVFSAAYGGAAAFDLALLLATLGAAALFVVGWIRVLVVPPMGLRATRAERVWRHAARIALLVVVSIAIGSAALGMTMRTPPMALRSPGPRGALQVLEAINLLASCAFWLAGLLWLRAILKRARTARRSPGTIVHVAIWTGACAILLYILAAMPSVAGVGIPELVYVAATLGGVACAIVAFFAYLFALGRVRTALARVGREIALAHRHALKPSADTPPA